MPPKTAPVIAPLKVAIPTCPQLILLYPLEIPWIATLIPKPVMAPPTAPATAPPTAAPGIYPNIRGKKIPKAYIAHFAPRLRGALFPGSLPTGFYFCTKSGTGTRKRFGAHPAVTPAIVPPIRPPPIIAPIIIPNIIPATVTECPLGSQYITGLLLQ